MNHQKFNNAQLLIKRVDCINIPWLILGIFILLFLANLENIVDKVICCYILKKYYFIFYAD